jgi:hypothetical protein
MRLARELPLMGWKAKSSDVGVVMFRLDYLSCFLTIVATVLIGRKMWTGLVVSGVNSLVVCVIGLHTSQYGFIPANVFCICMNAFSLRAWLKVRKQLTESTTDASSELLPGCKPMSTSTREAVRRLMSFFSLPAKVRLGNSISSLTFKGMRPFASPSHQGGRGMVLLPKATPRQDSVVIWRSGSVRPDDVEVAHELNLDGLHIGADGLLVHEGHPWSSWCGDYTQARRPRPFLVRSSSSYRLEDNRTSVRCDGLSREEISHARDSKNSTNLRCWHQL